MAAARLSRAANRERAAEVLKRLRDSGIAASICGEMTDKAHGIQMVESGRPRPFDHPGIDPFWDAFYKALKT